MEPAENLPPEDIDQQIRINELRESAREAAGGEMMCWEDPDTPPEVSEQFWQGMLDWDTCEYTRHIDQLADLGIQLPAPGDPNGSQLVEKLWEMINGLAELRVYLYRTDHLSDRELYTLLWEEMLRDETPVLPPNSGWRCHLDILGGCSEEDLYLDRKYYADEEERAQWAKDWPEDEMPDHVDPPYDRDSRLPKAED